MAGIYETYDSKVVTLLDERQSSCQDPNHVDGQEIPELAVSERSTTVLPDRRRHQS
jgi:hypothetical protein